MRPKGAQLQPVHDGNKMPALEIDTILFEAETRCNQDCIFCYNCWNALPAYPRGKLSTPKTIKMLRKAVKESGARTVAITGGEPLLRDDLPDIVAALTLGNVTVSLLTNGALMTREWASDLKSTGVKLFQLTLIAMDEKLHDLHCGGGTFKSVMKAYDILKSIDAYVSFTAVVTKRSVDALPKLLEFFHEADQDSFLLNRFNPGGRSIAEGFAKDLLLSRKETERMLAYAQEGATSLELEPAASVPIPPCVVDIAKYPNVEFAGCAAATDSAYFTLDPLGNVRMCNHSPIILGNILESSFQKITGSRACEDWIKTKPDFCKPCPGWDECKGGCRAVCQQMGLALNALDPYVACALEHEDCAFR